MELRDILQKAWENKGDIVKGFYNAYIHCTPELQAEAQKRIGICRQNTCGWWDEKGVMERTVLKGQEACGGCGCQLQAKAHNMQLQCYLGDIGQEPLWKAVTSEEMEKHVAEIRYQEQFNKPNNNQI